MRKARVGLGVLLAAGLAFAASARADVPAPSIYRIAGACCYEGYSGFSGDFGPAIDAKLATATGVAPTADGGFLIADNGNNRVRFVPGRDGTYFGQAMSAWDIYTVAGDGTTGVSGDGGPATSAELHDPTSVSPLPDGGFLIADYMNSRIRMVSPTGIISTVAGGRDCSGAGLPTGCGDGGPATSAQLNFPSGVAATPDGGFLIADTMDNSVRRVSPPPSRTIATVDTCYGSPCLRMFPTNVSPTSDGGFLIADPAHPYDTAQGYVFKVSAQGGIARVAGNGVTCEPNSAPSTCGDGGPATSAALRDPYDVSATSDDGFLIADGNWIREVSPKGTIAVVAGLANFDKHEYPDHGDGGPALSAAVAASGVAATPDGGFLIAGDSRIRKVGPSSNLCPGTPYPRPCADLAIKRLWVDLFPYHNLPLALGFHPGRAAYELLDNANPLSAGGGLHGVSTTVDALNETAGEFTVRNLGPDPSPGGSVTATFPGGLLNAAVPFVNENKVTIGKTECSSASSVVKCVLPKLAPGEAARIDLRGAVGAIVRKGPYRVEVDVAGAIFDSTVPDISVDSFSVKLSTLVNYELRWVREYDDHGRPTHAFDLNGIAGSPPTRGHASERGSDARQPARQPLISMVRVAIIRLGLRNRRLLRCGLLINTRPTFKTVRAFRGGCPEAAFLKANLKRGSSGVHWRFRLPHGLPRGNYLALVQAVNGHGFAVSRFDARNHNEIRITVR